MFYGKLIAGLIGLLVFGPIGLIIGVIIGHSFDRGLGRVFQAGSPENIARIKQQFFETIFLLLGHLAKADGRISQQEVDHTEMIIQQMGLDGTQRQRAIDLFRRGSAPEFELDAAVSAFMEVCGRQPQLRQTLLLFLISLALADHQLQPEEQQVLQRIASLLGFSAAQLDQLLRMARAQEQFHSGGASQPDSPDRLQAAYTALGVSPEINDRELKRVYRKLMSEHHPDKLIAKGVPEDMLKLATEKSQEITAAYELIRKHRAARG
ncbi:co-chaperone DjlA [Kineobactrum salinum]|uniref:Co-chaperone protein DjlA n=1 Tax=Kineobactrum salinum TaxID=2708301 RepID=A0A6C0U5H6_9GAMM|nr:co-chaperone DjlA [Kineobactrum salinum]QIB65655.1 co-chaperone DjlA [Kineobactrum salinum]